MAQHTAIVTNEYEQETVSKLSNGTIFNVSRGAAGHLPVSRHRQAALRIQCLDWIHQSD